MKVTISKKLWFGFGIILVLMCIISLLMLVNTDNIKKGFSSVIQRDMPTLIKGEQMIQAIENMQHAHMGYCVTNNEQYIDTYTESSKETEELLGELMKLAEHDPGQYKRLENIQGLISKWQQKIAMPEIEMAKEAGKGKLERKRLEDVIAKGKGKAILDELRVVTDKMARDFRIDGNAEGENITHSIVKSLVDKETGQRGFLITGKEVFLEPYIAGEKSMQQDIKKLKDLISNAHDRVGIANSINALEKLGKQWREEAGAPEIKLRRNLGVGAVTHADIEKALSGGHGKAILDKMRKIIDNMIDEFTVAQNDKSITLLIQAAKDMVDQETGQRGFIITGDESFLKPYKDGQKAFKLTLEKMRNLNSNAYNIAEMKASINKLQKLANRWEEEAAKPEIELRRKVAVSDRLSEKLENILKTDSGSDIRQQIGTIFEQFISEENHEVKINLADVYKSANITMYTTIIIVIISLVICVVTGIFTTFSISNPIKYITEIAQKISKKDLTVEVNIKESRSDEIGLLAKSFKNMVATLRQQSLEMSAGSTQLATSISEISSTTAQLAAATTETSTSITQITTTVEEVRQTSQSSHEMSAEVADKSDALSSTVDHGIKATGDTIEGINKINKEMEYIAQSTIKLGEQTQNIGEIINTVNGLADQSNLLSVNASIEAAKAGEYGKGFAVVAREVKNLADLSKEATKQISTILTDIQKASSAAVLATERGSKAVKEGLNLSSIAGTTINDLGQAIKEAAEASIQIAASSQEQVTGMDQLAATMENIKEALEQNVNGTQQLEASAESLNGLGEKLQEMANQFKLQ